MQEKYLQNQFPLIEFIKSQHLPSCLLICCIYIFIIMVYMKWQLKYYKSEMQRILYGIQSEGLVKEIAILLHCNLWSKNALLNFRISYMPLKCLLCLQQTLFWQSERDFILAKWEGLSVH